MWLRDPKPIYATLAIMAICCVVNIKFTGLVFVLIASLFVLIYTLIQRRHLIRSFLYTHLLAGLLAIGVFGYNPYITNFINRGNPLYPLMGSKQFPGVFDKGTDDNEAYETPKNMQGKSLSVRLLFANYGYPGNAPYNGEDTARLVNPLLITPGSWGAYHFHETRVAGFGPYFGLLLILSAIGITILIVTKKEFRLPLLIFLLAVCCGLSLSKHFWWPRFFPILWLVVVIPLFLFWAPADGSPLIHKRSERLKNAPLLGFAIFVGINGLIVAIVHMNWETASSISLRKELSSIRDAKKPVEIDYGWFKRSTEEKLNHWKIKYKPAVLENAPNAKKMTSVVKGYPNQILYRPLIVK